MSVHLVLVCLPIENLCPHFRTTRVGPSCFSIWDRYLIPASAPHPCPMHCMRVTTIAQTPSQNSALIVQAVPCQRWITDICLHSTWGACNEDLKEQVPRLWNCPPAAATESYIQDTTDSLETSLVAEEKYYWVLGYGGDVINWSLEIGISSLTVVQLVTREQEHTRCTLRTLGLWGSFTVLLIRYHIHLLSLRLHFCFISTTCLCCLCCCWDCASIRQSCRCTLQRPFACCHRSDFLMCARWRPSFSSSIVSLSGCSICCCHANPRMLLMFFLLCSLSIWSAASMRERSHTTFEWLGYSCFLALIFSAVFLGMHFDFSHLFEEFNDHHLKPSWGRISTVSCHFMHCLHPLNNFVCLKLYVDYLVISL